MASADHVVDEFAGPPVRPVLTDPLAGAPKGLEVYYSQKLFWRSCDEWYDDWFDDDHECALLKVPLDYAEPRGDRGRISVLRVPADPARRMGSLVVNPGGPGHSGMDFADVAGEVFAHPILERFDIVGFDPRGTGSSSFFDCLSDSAMDEYLALDPTPDDAAERAEFAEATEAFGAGCSADDDAPYYAHVTTVEVARDMDVLRAALRHERLDYFGASYGTKLGATYADLFPERVGRMVLDGGLGELNDDAAVPSQVKGFQTALEAYVADCVEGGDCVLGGSREAGLARISKFFDGLDAASLNTDDPDRDLTEGHALRAVVSQLYSRAYWSSLTSAFEDAFAGDGTALLSFADAFTGRWPDGDSWYYDGTWESFVGITCADDPSSLTVDKIPARVPAFEKVSPIFGKMAAYGLATCSGFQGRSLHARHQINATGIDPILVTGTTRDPATTLKEAEALASKLESAVLIRRDGDGHTAYNSGNECVDEAIESYLLDGTVPTGTLDC